MFRLRASVLCTLIMAGGIVIGGIAGAEPAVPPVAQGGAVAAPDAPERSFLSHRATYKMQMVAARDTRNISSVGGTISFEWADSCAAWTTTQKFSLEYQYTEADPEIFTSDYSSWEAKDGKSFSFTSRQGTKGADTDLVRGTVERSPAGAVVEYIRPQKETVKLEGDFFFPAHHTFEVMRRAARGEKFFSTPLFDGSAEKVPSLVSAVVLARLPALDAEAQKNPLLRVPGYRLRMAFFDPLDPAEDDPASSAAPAYEMTLDLQENGVVRKIRIDYREFSIEGTVDTLDLVPVSGC